MFWKGNRQSGGKGASKRAADLYFLAFEHASIPTLSCDTSGCILEVNAEFTEFLGYGDENVRSGFCHSLDPIQLFRIRPAPWFARMAHDQPSASDAQRPHCHPVPV